MTTVAEATKGSGKAAFFPSGFSLWPPLPSVLSLSAFQCGPTTMGNINTITAAAGFRASGGGLPLPSSSLGVFYNQMNYCYGFSGYIVFITRGLEYLPEDCHPWIIHRDIKSLNIQLDDNYDAQSLPVEEFYRLRGKLLEFDLSGESRIKLLQLLNLDISLKSVVNVMLKIIQEHIPNANLLAVLNNMNVEVPSISSPIPNNTVSVSQRSSSGRC